MGSGGRADTTRLTAYDLVMARRLRTLFAIVIVVAAGCSGGGDESASPAEEIVAIEGLPATPDEPVVITVPDEPLEPADPVVRTASNDAPLDVTNWVARTFMDETRVDIVWSPVDDADAYRLYVVPTAQANYEALALGDLDGTELVYEGLEFGFVDANVPANSFLTYVLVAEVGGAFTEPRWTEALTTTDITSPTPITGLSATVTDDGVLLEWEPSFDYVEFAAYSVNVLNDTGNFEYIGGGTEENQTSFIDTEAPSGPVTYLVQAFDFHDNGSEFAEVTVEVP